MRSNAKRSCRPSVETSETIFWIPFTHYSDLWIILCEERQGTRGYRQQPPAAPGQLTDMVSLQPEQIAAIIIVAVLKACVGWSAITTDTLIAPTTLKFQKGSIPIRSFTASRSRCLQPRYFSVVCTETCPSKN